MRRKGKRRFREKGQAWFAHRWQPFNTVWKRGLLVFHHSPTQPCVCQPAAQVQRAMSAEESISLEKTFFNSTNVLCSWLGLCVWKLVGCVRGEGLLAHMLCSAICHPWHLPKCLTNSLLVLDNNNSISAFLCCSVLKAWVIRLSFCGCGGLGVEAEGVACKRFPYLLSCTFWNCILALPFSKEGPQGPHTWLSSFPSLSNYICLIKVGASLKPWTSDLFRLLALYKLINYSSYKPTDKDMFFFWLQKPCHELLSVPLSLTLLLFW